MISVIIPIYNMEKYIEQCVDSVLAQEYTEFEILLINDGSTDNTDKICKTLEKMDERVIYIYKENTGVSDTRNYGIKRAKGEYIIFLDADDILPTNSLLVLFKEINTGKYDIVFGGFEYDYDGRRVKKLSRIQDGEYTYEEIKNELVDDGTLSGILFGSVWASIYRKSVIDKYKVKFDKTIKINEDGIFNLELIRYTSKIKVITSTSVYIYRQWKSYKKIAIEKNKELEKATKKIEQLYIDKKGTSIYKQLMRRKVSLVFWNALKVRSSDINYKQARIYLKELFNEDSVEIGLKYMNYKKMNLYKKMLCFFIKKKQYLCFYIAIHYIYEILENKVKR